MLALLAMAVLLAMNVLQSGRDRAREWVADLLRIGRRNGHVDQHRSQPATISTEG